ncbi:hypothetical protein BGZ46_000020 [Entomortierella lignicola]|nr:hypothetical protein BGZ46_000020 [Entomortierella lignicola]
MEPTPTSSVQGTAALAAMHTSRQNASTNTCNANAGIGPSTTTTNTNQRQNPVQTSDSSMPGNMASFLKELDTIKENSRSKQKSDQQQQQPEQASSQSSTAGPAPAPGYQEPNRCYICFGTEEDSEGRWVKPCQCTLISHEDCLLDWIDKNRQQFAKKQSATQFIALQNQIRYF